MVEAKDKIKRMQQAEKYVLQGKISSAIAAYRKIASEFPADMLLLNTIGDLFLRNGNKTEAINHFSRVAESYVKTGFTLKAIAVYKKVLNIDPQNLETCEKLAGLYAKQGLNVEAKNQYLAIADTHSKKGLENEAIAYYQKASELDPNDVAIAVKLADVYSQKGDTERAKVCYTNAGAALAKAKSYEESLQAFRKALELDANDTATLRGFLDLGLATKNLRPMIDALERAHRERPDDIETMEMLGQAYMNVEREEDAERIFQQVLAADENRFHNFLDLGHWFYNKNKFDKAVEQISCISNILLSRRESDKIISFLKEIREIDPCFMPALFKLAEVYYKTNNEKEYVTILAKIVDIYIGQEEYLEALNILERLIHTDFYNQKFLRMHKEVFQEAYPDKDYHPPAPEPQLPTSAPAIEEASAKAPAVPEPTLPVAAAPEEPPAIEVDLSEDLKEIFSHKAEAVDQPEKAPSWDTYEVNNQQPEPTTHGTPDPTLATGLQEIDFYIRLGFYSEAETRLAELEKAFPEEKGIYLRQRQIEEEKGRLEAKPAGRKKTSDPVYKEPSADNAFPLNRLPEGAAPTAHETEDLPTGAVDETVTSKYKVRELDGIKPEEARDEGKKPKPFAEVMEEINKFVGEEKEEDFQTHFDLGVAYKEMRLIDEAIGEFQTAYRIAKAVRAHANTAHCCTILASCFMEKGMPGSAVKWCKHGLTVSGLPDDEIYALKYELATAYEKCGELKSAFDCLSEIYEMNINYRDIARKISYLNELIDSKPS